jgi:hypothetical protein
MVDSRYNEDRSPVKNNPERDFVKGGDGRTGPLRLALNTAQTGRTFQDRSHKFRIVKRPDELPNGVMIHNLNVRGRRGNIVQVRTAMGFFDHARGCVTAGIAYGTHRGPEHDGLVSRSRQLPSAAVDTAPPLGLIVAVGRIDLSGARSRKRSTISLVGLQHLQPHPERSIR